MTKYHYSDWLDEEEHARLLRERKWLNCQERIYSSKIYQLTHDPHEDWGFQTRLSKRDIERLMKENSIAAGCRFHNLNTGNDYEIVCVRKGKLERLVMVPCGEERVQ